MAVNMKELEKNLRGEITRLKAEIEDLKHQVNIQATVIRIVRGAADLLPCEKEDN